MQEMLRKFKVPAGLTPEEVEQTKEFFATERQKTWLGRVKQRLAREPQDLLNDHSRVMYLMSSDNKFLAFY
jgi:cytochrome oxidase Cu insertion factor (SCO1/SenC/PrrC family)